MIVAVVVIGVSLGWVVRLAHNQRDAVAAIRRAGLTSLNLLFPGGTQVSDAGLMHLKGLTRLSSLDLQGTHGNVIKSPSRLAQATLPGSRTRGGGLRRGAGMP
jgi:hypothetical protein